MKADEVDVRYWASVPLPGSYDDLFNRYGTPYHPDFVEDLTTVSTHTINGKPLQFRHHVALLKPLHDVFLCLGARNLLQAVYSFDGCFNIRNIAGSNQRSLHSWGLAIDINAADNARGTKGLMSDKVIAVFETFGFFWGGHFYRIPDPMHFQFTKPHSI